jgi:competence protein ComEA
LTVDINGASSDDLQRLPGIGPRLAARIVADRARRGPLTAVDQLTRVSGIGPAKLARLRALVHVGARDPCR